MPTCLDLNGNCFVPRLMNCPAGPHCAVVQQQVFTSRYHIRSHALAAILTSRACAARKRNDSLGSPRPLERLEHIRGAGAVPPEGTALSSVVPKPETHRAGQRDVLPQCNPCVAKRAKPTLTRMPNPIPKTPTLTLQTRKSPPNSNRSQGQTPVLSP